MNCYAHPKERIEMTCSRCLSETLHLEIDRLRAAIENTIQQNHETLKLLQDENEKLKAEVERVTKERDEWKSAHEKNLARWEVVEGEFRTKREADITAQRDAARREVERLLRNERSGSKDILIGQLRSELTALREVEKKAREVVHGPYSQMAWAALTDALSRLDKVSGVKTN